ncbi:single-stranded-DNA-specific exonuclease [Nitrosospira sp. Nsp2]|uniref:single-stranded-DNA-specific exonuclease RecJ n=1 Tax=Nitrosospira sp. Nsp2 TaxID=136548 RepID=UPI000D30AF0F|nr:single-stranded-DNA-specific exonuclease RecJ [Nitrosospira sp. Nsp2]PTR13483.1 single-stranded-DNA-specific exonuclease [Nitrosospira sp. Nsp2]
MPNTISRGFPPSAFDTLTSYGIHPVLARVYAARGIEEPGQLEVDWSRLVPFGRLKNICQMARFIADAIAARKRMLIVADYDSDGATACAVGIRGLRKFGAIVDYLVPDRFEYGYGLTPEIVRLASAVNRPDILITVDNGIASVEGVAEARRLGMEVLVTDHHLPGDELPDAALIVNPNQPGCDFPSKHLAGVGVIFYLMLALRAELRARAAFASEKEPNLAELLDLVALGTVADVVRLDNNNRILVHYGLRRIRGGRACPGINALLQVAQRDFSRASAYDLGFALGPRLNAAGRLENMSLGIDCLVTDDESDALEIAHQLDSLNRKRQEIEANMHDSARVLLGDELPVGHLADGEIQPRNIHSLSLFDPGWHQGVIGILASRIKDKYYRPVIAFAPGSNGEIKGSGRSIPGFHLRDALDLISKRYPGLLLKFGGHAAAAGLTLHARDFEKFRDVFEQTAQGLLAPADLKHVIETDGDLDESELNLELAVQLTQQVWGQGFAQPTFSTCFCVVDQRVVGKRHLKLKLSKSSNKTGAHTSEKRGRLYDAILFSSTITLPEVIHAVYRLQVNEFNGNSTLQFIVDHWSQADA